MASALISSILKATGDWLSLIRSTPTTSSTSTSVADDVEKLERMLQRIKAVLQDAEEREIVDKSVKLWLKEIKEVAYDAEDLLDEYQYHVLQAQVENLAIEEGAAAAAAEASRKRKRKYVDGEEEVMPLASSSSSASNLAVSKITILSSMADRIKKIRKRFKEISKDRDRLQLRPEDGKRRHDSIYEYPPPTSHMVKEQETYGRNDDREKLVDWLLSNKESKFEVVAVVGKGGLGKTTLAQLVYNDQKVTNYFQLRIWICVSDDFDIVRLTRAMIESITKASCTTSNQLSVLQEALQKELQEKRVLLVLDDVWNERKDLWQTLSIPFHDAEIMRIAVTTRNIPVAEVMQTTHPYRLGYLPEEQCWNLFIHHAFHRRDPKQFPLLVDIGKKIVKKCGGLPLAVKSLGGLLQHERDEDKWNYLLESEVWQSDEKIGILPALKLSYIHLPSHLKPCFEICCMFPKHCLFRKDELVKLWVAHGYIQRKVEQNAVEEIGYSYFNELHRRSFFDEFNQYGGKKYMMHDNIHDLAHYVQVETDLNNHSRRHLSIINKSSAIQLDDIGVLRTLILRTNSEAINDMLRRNIRKLRHLRYLIFLYTSEEEYLLSGDLIFLRLLKLCIISKMKLPKSIDKLYNLAVLEIRCRGFVELPETRNLVSLTTIHFSGFHDDQLPTLGQLPSLRTLILIRFINVKNIGNEFYRGTNNCHRVAFPSLTSLVFKEMHNWKKWEEFQKGDFPQLQKLKINNCGVLSSLPSLGNLSLLSHMSIKECASLRLSTESPFPPYLKTLNNISSYKLSLPQGFRELDKLKRLSGSFGVRSDEVFGIMKKLASLEYLTLSQPCNAHGALNNQGCLREYHQGVERLVISWSFPLEKVQRKGLHLVVEGGCSKRSHQTDGENASFSLLDNFHPHPSLDYQYPSWIGDPSFNKLAHVKLEGSKIDRLPALGQLPFLENLHLFSIFRLKRVGEEFYRGISDSHDEVAFPSLTQLLMIDMHDWEEWLGMRQGDLPLLRHLKLQGCPKLSSVPCLQSLYLLQNLSINECPLMQLPSIVSFPPNLTSLQYDKCGSNRMYLPPRGKLVKFETLSGEYGVKKDDFFENLNNIPVTTMHLSIRRLWKLHGILEVEFDLKSLHELQSLELDWGDATDRYYIEPLSQLLLVVEDDDDSKFLCSGNKDESEKTSFFLLEKLQPHTDLHDLHICSYDGVGYPDWIGHPSFVKLDHVCLRRCTIDQLPTLGELPSLRCLRLFQISRLKSIGNEFYRGTNDDNHNVVAFPSLTTLEFIKMHDLTKWDGVRLGDFPELKSLTVNDCPKLSSLPVLGNLGISLHLTITACPAIHISAVGSFPPNPKTLEYGNCELRNDERFGILNNLPTNTNRLTIAALMNVHNGMQAEANLKSQHGLESLTLKWSTYTYRDRYIFPSKLCLVAEDNHGFVADDDENSNQTDKASYYVLEKFQPHTNLQVLNIEGYLGVGYPSWIGHPSFDKLRTIRLWGFKNEQLPTLGQLPSLEHLDLNLISNLKRIGHELCRGTIMNNQSDQDKVAFPSLRFLHFRRMHAWVEWYGVLDGDFPRLESLTIEDCPGLRRDLISLPRSLLQLF